MIRSGVGWRIAMKGKRSGGDGTAAAAPSSNQLEGVVVDVERGAVMASVRLRCGRRSLTALVSLETADELQLVPGVRAVAQISPTDIVLRKRRRAVE